MNISSSQLMETYDNLSDFIRSNALESNDFSKIQSIFEDKKSKPDANIMVYGVYNAGKSTLINALVGEEVAAVGDVPLTDTVTQYKWQQYQILDTPGVDAPIHHEEITKAELLKADAIVFVVNPLGVVEEVQTLNVLMDLLQAKKKVVLVFNEKNPLSEENFAKLKNQTRERIQNMALSRSLDSAQTLSEIPIFKVNARLALQGKVKKQAIFIEKSGFNSFENHLIDFLQSVSQADVYGRLKTELINYLDQLAEHFKASSSSSVTAGYDKLISELEMHKQNIRKTVLQEIDIEKKSVFERTKAILRKNPTNAGAEVSVIFEKSSLKIQGKLSDALEVFASNFQEDLSELILSIPVNSEKLLEIKHQKIDQVAIGETNNFSDNPEISLQGIGNMVNGVAGIAKPEHIVAGLQVVKQYIPNMMKGIGAKGMEKIAGNVVAKYIPYIGSVIQVVSILYSLFGEDSKQKENEEIIRQEKLAQERFLQQVEDSARDISEQFEDQFITIVRNCINEVYLKAMNHITPIRNGFKEKDRLSSQRLESVEKFKALAVAA